MPESAKLTFRMTIVYLLPWRKEIKSVILYTLDSRFNKSQGTETFYSLLPIFPIAIYYCIPYMYDSFKNKLQLFVYDIP